MPTITLMPATMRTAISLLLVSALLITACGGGGDEGESFDGTTVRSDDGVLTVEVPKGAAADGVEVTIAAISEEELPAGLQGADADAVVIVGYELGPDGAQFSEPVVVTFQLDPDDIGLDLREGAVPITLVLTEGVDGDLESVEEAEIRRVDGALVIRARVTHFSMVLAMLRRGAAIELDPARVELVVGQSIEVRVLTPTVEDPDATFAYDDVDWEAVKPFTAWPVGASELVATVSCEAATDGWVPGAYKFSLEAEHGGGGFGALWTLSFFSGLDIFGAKANFRYPGYYLSGDGKCNGSTTDPTPDPTTELTPGPTTDPTSEPTTEPTAESTPEPELSGTATGIDHPPFASGRTSNSYSIAIACGNISGVPAGTTVTIAVEGAGASGSFEATTDASGAFSILVGIFSYSPIEWSVEQVLTPDGELIPGITGGHKTTVGDAESECGE